MGLDLDPQALELANQRLAVFSGRFTLVQASYTSLLDQMQAYRVGKCAGNCTRSGRLFDADRHAERGFRF